MLVLRDMIEQDIEDYVYWWTEENEWMHWDAPWETVETDASIERRSWTEYFNTFKNIEKESFRWKYEIEVDGEHIGWISAYTDFEYFENETEEIAVGIVIPELRFRKKGYGVKAFLNYIDYLKKHGYQRVFTQTWSGNHSMIALAKKLGFQEYIRKKNLRKVENKLYDAITFVLEF